MVHFEFSSALQETLLEQPSCFLEMDRYYGAVVQHKEYFMVLNFNVCDAFGFPCEFGTCVLQCFSSLVETLQFFSSLFCKLNAKMFSAYTVTVKSIHDLGMPQGTELKDCYVSLTRMTNVKVGKATDATESTEQPVKNKLGDIPSGLDACIQEKMINSVQCVQGSFHQGHPRLG